MTEDFDKKVAADPAAVKAAIAADPISEEFARLHEKPEPSPVPAQQTEPEGPTALDVVETLAPFLERGIAAQEQVAERERDEALELAMGSLEDWEDPDAVREAAAELVDTLGPSDPRVGQFLDAWREDDPVAADMWVWQANDALQAQQRGLQVLAEMQAQAEADRVAQENAAKAAEAISEVRERYGKRWDALAGDMQAILENSPELLHSLADPALAGQAAEMLAKSAAELRRTAGSTALRAAIMNATPNTSIGDGIHQAGQEPDLTYRPTVTGIDTGRVTPKPSSDERISAFKAFLREKPASDLASGLSSG